MRIIIMATKRSSRLTWLVALIAAAGIAAGSWYAYSHGWLTHAYAWLRHSASRDQAAKSDEEEMVDMPGMPGMKMPKGQQNTAAASGVPGHAEVVIPAEIQQRIGVTVGQVVKSPLRMSVDTVGIVGLNEPKVSHVHLRTEGWVEQLFVNYTGQVVHEGDPLLSIYSPDFLSTQQEYLNARQAERRTESADRSSLAELALLKLELWGVSREELDKLEKAKKPQKNLILRSPQEGTVVVKNAFKGQRVTPQDELYVVADLSTVWVQAKVYTYELPHVEVGQPATVTIPDLSEREFAGKVVFIQPTVEESTRTVQVRIELDNRKGLLKPGLFAHVNIAHTMGEGLLVPTSAIVRTGDHSIAFRAESGDRFVPVEVKISAWKFGDRFHVLEGLRAGDKVVTSANFLIDSESRLRLGGGGMAGMTGMDMGDIKGMDHSKMKH